MTRILKSAFVCLLGLVVMTGCKKEKDGSVPNLTPETTVSVKEVTLADETTLTSTVHVYWSGNDQDGFVKGYQISLDGATWSNNIRKTDSLFRFSFGTASDTATIRFHVRAIDNIDAADPTPAILKLPLRNSSPNAAWDGSQVPMTDTIYSVITLPFLVSDPDGNETLDTIYVRLNGDANPWLAIPKTSNLITFLAERPMVAETQRAIVYLNGNTTPWPTKIQGFRVGGTNTFELKAIDIAQTTSPIARITDTSGNDRQFYVTRQTSDLLILDSHQGSGASNPDPVYADVLAQVYPSYDRINMTVGNGKNQPYVYDATMRLLLGLYSKVFWYMDNQLNTAANRADPTRVLLESVSNLLGEYISRDGKLLLSSPFPDATGRLSRDSPVFGLLPVDSIPYVSSTLRIGIRNLIASSRPGDGYPDLTSSLGTSGADVMYPSPSADSLYSVPSMVRGGTPPYPGPKIVAVRGRNNVNGQVNLIFFSIELNRLNGNPDNFRVFFDKVLNQEFGQ